MRTATFFFVQSRLRSVLKRRHSYILLTLAATALASLWRALLTLASCVSSFVDADDCTVGDELPTGIKRKSRRASLLPVSLEPTPVARPSKPPIFFPVDAAFKDEMSVYRM